MPADSEKALKRRKQKQKKHDKQDHARRTALTAQQQETQKSAAIRSQQQANARLAKSMLQQDLAAAQALDNQATEIALKEKQQQAWENFYIQISPLTYMNWLKQKAPPSMQVITVSAIVFPFCLVMLLVSGMRMFMLSGNEANQLRFSDWQKCFTIFSNTLLALLMSFIGSDFAADRVVSAAIKAEENHQPAERVTKILQAGGVDQKEFAFRKVELEKIRKFEAGKGYKKGLRGRKREQEDERWNNLSFFERLNESHHQARGLQDVTRWGLTTIASGLLLLSWWQSIGFWENVRTGDFEQSHKDFSGSQWRLLLAFITLLAGHLLFQGTIDQAPEEQPAARGPRR